MDEAFNTLPPGGLRKFLFSAFILLFLSGGNFLQAQIAAIEVYAGNDTSASCSNPCVTLNPTFSNSFETTSYLVWPTAYNPYSFTTGTPIFVNTDDIWSSVINLPFNFCFFGANYNQVVLGANGIISFNVSYANGGCPWNLQGAPNSNPIPNPSLPLNSIMGIYQDIDPTNQGDVYYLINGTFPNRRLILSYYQVPYYGDPNSVSTGSCPNPLYATMQVVLHETTNVIDMYVQNKPFCPGWNQGRAIQGIQNATGTVAYSIPGRNNQQFSLVNDAVLFVPFGALSTSVRWLQGGTVISGTSTVSVCPSVPTDYVFEATYLTCSGTNVVLTDTVRVSPASSFGGSVALTQALSCSNSSNASATATPTSGAAPYTYLWSNGATTATATGLSAGTYTVTITEAGGCNSIASIVITAPGSMVVTPGTSIPVSCFGGTNGSLSVNVNGGQLPYTYLWSNAATTATASVLTAGNYAVTVTDNLGCTASWNGLVTEPATALTVSSPVSTPISCFGSTDGGLTITANGGTAPYTYLWSSGSITASVINLGAGTHTVTVTDSRGCTAQTSALLVTPTQVNATLISTNNVSCFGANDGSISVIITGGAGGYQYLWSPSGGTASVGGNLVAGTYTVTITDINGCTGQLSGLTVTQPQSIIVSSTVQDVLCDGGTTGSVNLTVSSGTAPYQYLWNNGATTSSVSGLSSGSYTVTVTDQNACSTQHNVQVNQPAALAISNINVINASCFGFSNGSINLTVIGGATPYNYTWNPAVSTGASALNLPAGNYDYQVTDNNGCLVAGSATVAQPAAVAAVVLTQKDVSCNGGNDGLLALNVAGGTAPYTYTWSPSGGNSSIAQGLIAGIYSVQVRDNAGCTFSLGNLTITEPAAITAQLNPVNVSCPQGADGSISIQPQGGTAPYLYSWNSGAITSVINGLPAGNYTATVTDASGCSTSFIQTLTTPAAFVTTTSSTPSKCNAANATATITVSGGNSPYVYLWSNGSVNAQLLNLPAGNYTVLVTDTKGCTTSDAVIITALPIPTVAIAGKDSICELETATLSAQTQFAVSPISYSWSPGAGSTTSVNVTPSANQLYTVLINDANGCTATATHTIRVQPAPEIIITGSDQFSCMPFEYTFAATVDIPNCSYLWNFGDLKTSTLVAPTHSWKTPGTFNISLQATSPTGCTNTVVRNGMITIHPFPEADFTMRPDVLYDYQPVAYFQNTSVGGLKYWWDFGDGSPLETTYSTQHLYADTGIYMVTLVVESEHGCLDTVYGPVRYLLQSNIYVPMAFTPNYDGKNDEFAVVATELADFNLLIKNRWGQTVFSADNLATTWDGRTAGTDCPNDVYVYLIKYKSTNGKSGELSGRLTLYR